jgi:predicted RNase H-related nuclease YkuK (DUF458 family)
MIYILYLISAEIDGKKYYKIGYTKRSVEERIKEFKTGNVSEFEIVDSFSSKWGSKIESLLHKYYKDKKVNGEWFDLNEKEVSKFNEACQKIHNNFKMMFEVNTYIMDRVEKGKKYK